MMATMAYSQDTDALTGVDQTYIRSMVGGAGDGYSLGWEFQLNQNAQVSALGLLDLGFTSDHEVGIWNTSGQLLGNATVSETATPDSNGFAWATLGSDIHLSAGQDYVISAWYPTDSGSCDNFVVFGSAPETSSDVDVVSAELGALTTSFDYPDNANGAFNAGVFGPNFEYTTTSVPEPSTMALTGLGGLSLLLYRRRK
ncbi:MAG: DUF4082 domain-containing protein [Verrucomicrobiota bacterium]